MGRQQRRSSSARLRRRGGLYGGGGHCVHCNHQGEPDWSTAVPRVLAREQGVRSAGSEKGRTGEKIQFWPLFKTCEVCTAWQRESYYQRKGRLKRSVQGSGRRSQRTRAIWWRTKAICWRTRLWDEQAWKRSSCSEGACWNRLNLQLYTTDQLKKKLR